MKEIDILLLLLLSFLIHSKMKQGFPKPYIFINRQFTPKVSYNSYSLNATKISHKYKNEY